LEPHLVGVGHLHHCGVVRPHLAGIRGLFHHHFGAAAVPAEEPPPGPPAIGRFHPVPTRPVFEPSYDLPPAEFIAPPDHSPAN
jgi:hypothetical protein